MIHSYPPAIVQSAYTPTQELEDFTENRLSEEAWLRTPTAPRYRGRSPTT